METTAEVRGGPVCSREHGLSLPREMLRIRRFEEKSAELCSLSKIRSFLHLYIGEETVAVGAMRAFGREDNIVSTYREDGHALARGIPAGAVMAEMFGKANGCSRSGSMHLFDVARRFYGGHAIVAGGLPIAAGLAPADRRLGRGAIMACFLGDGAVAEGMFHESLNLAAFWKLPVLSLFENNLYAMGPALERHQAQTQHQPHGRSYGLPGEPVDGMDARAVRAATRRAARPRRRRPVPARGPDLPLPRTLDVRPGTLPEQGRGRALEATRPDPRFRGAAPGRRASHGRGTGLDRRGGGPLQAGDPHYYLATTIDLLRALTWLEARSRERAVEDFPLPGVLLLKAVALALREVPELNATWYGERVVPAPSIHLGVAIALRGGGRVAPALHEADRQDLDELMRRLRDLVNRARAGSLRGTELSNPTITVTNLGDQRMEAVFGVVYPPQVALVGLGKVFERPWVVEGQVVLRRVFTATLWADHRVSDSHRGGLFLAAVDRLLQEPSQL